MTEQTADQGDGWRTIWDGSSVAALRAYGGREFPSDRWVQVGEALETVPGSGTDLITFDTFGDFEVRFEWRVSRGGNSGVIYRVIETDGPAWHTGPEYQILDDDQHRDGGDPLTSAGALYGLIPPGPDKQLEPVGGWNAGAIVHRGGTVEHWLNGRMVVRYGWDDPAVREQVRASKFAEFDGFMRQARGHLVFQHHGEQAWFRNIRVRTLEEDPQP